MLVDGEPLQRVLLGLKKEGFGAGKITGFGGKVELGETPPVAARRELHEETGIMVAPGDLQAVGQLVFLFPDRPAWSQRVHVFLCRSWIGAPQEGREMKPTWFGVDDLPFSQMWQDAWYWLPRFLIGERIRASFVFDDDNETVVEAITGRWAE